MSYQGIGTDWSFTAAADLRTKQFYGIKVDSAGKAALAGAGEFGVGVLQNNPNTGEAATVRVGGITKAIAGGVIAPGARVGFTAAGKVLTAIAAKTDTSDAGAAADALIGSHVFGIALNEANSADGDVIPVLITHAGAVPTTATAT